jgi:osmotically-inducible protein OsmY
MVGDKTLQRLVQEELDYEPSFDAAHIGVTANKGVITLSGHVASYAEKRAAEQAASRVKGVKAVAQEIEVRLPFEKKRADDEIAERALQILAWDVSVPSDRIQVRVEAGWVTLSGEVEWQYQKDAAEHDVHKLGGVTGINNLIEVRATAQPSDVRAQIEQAFRRYAELEASGITITASAGTITLEGTVRSPFERYVATRAAWSAPGVTRVEDRIAVA